MTAWLVALWLAAAPASLEGLPALREGPTAPVSAPSRVVESNQEPCRISRRSFEDPRVRSAWLAKCEGEQALVLATDGTCVLVGLFSQRGNDPVLSFRANEGTVFSEQKIPAWVNPKTLEVLREQRRRATSGSDELAVDPTDGSIAVWRGESFSRVRPNKNGPEVTPLFAKPPPPEARIPMLKAFFSVEREPWLIYGVDPWHAAELRLRAPSGEEQVLLKLPVRTTGGSLRLENLQVVRVGAQKLPVISALVDRAWVLFTPGPSGYLARASTAPSYFVTVRPPPAGQSRAVGKGCSEAILPVLDEGIFDPQLFEYRDRAMVVFLSGPVRTSLRLGYVPRAEGPTCDWIIDACQGSAELVLGQITADGQVRELSRTQMDVSPGASFFGSTNVISRTGDTLTVVSSSSGLIDVTSFDLSKLVGK